MAYPCFTKTYRKTSYAAIDPARPALSAENKTVIVTGAGHGSIGSTVALAFAKAGARKLALVGRTQSTLQKTKETIAQTYPEATVLVSVADISKAESVGTAAHHIRVELGAWDVFANCAGYGQQIRESLQCYEADLLPHRYLPALTSIAGADEDEWWKAFEIHAKFATHFAKHFLPKCRPNAAYINTNAASCHLPASHFPKTSAYLASKLAMAKLDEYLAEESPQLRVFTVHPGVVQTKMVEKVMGGLDRVPAGDFLDEPELPANFMVWLASGEGDFLKSGRYLWANWDVEELIARKAEIQADPSLFRITIGGWPFQ
ncbi:putative NADP(+)-dependent dehydrogenase [Cladophialophora carrionii]|uniref:Putative NADP(+)-dependent dehydrogenase n=1 Tax=Cladophialophora carrionii TaxID=86049 RepID=A0A1C1CHC3_9EURO|nr:putative NADP(+)-dependent dehydrogenase [Cladophialophora carrionii]